MYDNVVKIHQINIHLILKYIFQKYPKILSLLLFLHQKVDKFEKFYIFQTLCKYYKFANCNIPDCNNIANSCDIKYIT